MYRNLLHRVDKPASHFSRTWGGIFILMLVCAFIGAGITTLLPRAFAVHAAGAATLTLSPTSAPYTNRDDQDPIAVNGTNFGANETVNVYWNYTGLGTGTLEATTTTDANGKFGTGFYLLSVLSPTGTYTVAGVGQTSGKVATATFTLFPQLYVRAQAGGPGSSTTVIGNAFGAHEAVKIYWNYISSSNPGKLLTTVNGDANGSFTVNVNVPGNATPNFYQFGGVGQTSNQVSKYKYTLYAPTLALAPLHGSPNSRLTVSAYGLRGLENVDIYWDNNTTPIATGTTSNFGYLAPTLTTVPTNASPGSHTVKVLGSTSGIAITNTYTVLDPSSSLSTTSGPVGVRVKVSGQGYAPQETVNILWNYTGPGTGTNVGSITSGYSGAIQGSFGVPNGANGAYTVALVGASSNSVTKNTITVNNSLAASPNSTSPGKSVTVNGTGFQAGESVQLFWDNTSGKLLATATANAHGNVNQPVTIPSGASAGAHSIIGVGQTSGQSLTASFTVNTNWGDFGFDNQHSRNNLYEHRVSSNNVANLKLKWSVTTTAGLEASPVYAKGIVYIPTMNGFLNAYNATTGSLLWQFNCQCIFRSFASPLVDPATNIVFWGTVGYADEGIPSPFYAIDAQSGTLLWSEILNWHQLGFPTVAFNTLYIGTSHLDHTGSSIYALDEVSGSVRWQYNYDAGFWGAVAADTNTNTVFSGIGNGTGNQDAAVIAFNASTGAVIWRTPIHQILLDDDVGSGITLFKGLVYASSKNGSVYALNKTNGSIAWSTPAGNGTSNGNISTQAVSASGILYVGSMDFNLYAMNATTGVVLWKALTGARIFSSPAVANGVVYFSSFDHKIYAVNGKTGAVLWTFTTAGSSYSSPVFVNGWLYCGSSDGKLYAFSL